MATLHRQLITAL